MRPGGQVLGQLTTLNTIIPEHRGGLDDVAQRLAAAINGGQAAGWDFDGNNPAPALLGSSSGPITAAALVLLTTDPRAVAASAVAPGPLGPSKDGSNADAIAQLRLSITGPDARYRQLIVDLGVQAAVTRRNLDVQQVITTQVDAARNSVAGVNIDEEMTNMLASQHAYAGRGAADHGDRPDPGPADQPNRNRGALS